MKNARRIIPNLVTLAVLAIFVWYVFNNSESFSQLLDIPILLGVLLLVFNALRIYNNGSFLRQTLDFYKKKISGWESFYIALLTAIGNFFGPVVSGVGVRAVYLKKKHDFSYTDFASTLSGFYLITFVVNASIGLAALAVIQAQTGFYSTILYVVFGAWLAGSILLSQIHSLQGATDFIKRSIPLLHKIFEYANNVVKGWQSIKRSRNLFLRLNRINIYGFVILFIITYIEFKAIGVSASLASLALYASLTALSMLVSLTPGAIGIREAIFIFSQQLIGINTDQILAIAVIDRASMFLVLAGSFAIFKASAPLRMKLSNPS